MSLRFAERDGELNARIDENGRSCAPHHDGCRYELSLGDVAVVSDASTALVPDDPEYVGQYLSDADESGLTYDGAVTTLVPYCAELVVEQPGCVPERCSSCQLGFESETTAISGGGGSLHLEDVVRKVTDGTCAPCPPDPLRSLLPRLKTILDTRRFRTSLGDPRSLRLYRRRSDCEAHLQELLELDQ